MVKEKNPGKAKINTKENLEKKNKGREMSVYKSDAMIQKGRQRLTIQEQKCVLYAISKIKPTDEAFKEYTFDIKDFYILCGIESDSYNYLKNLLKGLSDRSWWAEIDDSGTESLLRWFSTLKTNKKSGKVTFKFHEDMMPFLLKVTADGKFFTHYNLKYILPMNSQYSPRLYELLKSYEKTTSTWFFEVDELKKLLDAENYKNFSDFRRFALDPAVAEINKYTDIQIVYKLEKTGVKYTKITFLLDRKTNKELAATNSTIVEVLDGQMGLFEDQKEEVDPIEQYISEREKAKEDERKSKKKDPPYDAVDKVKNLISYEFFNYTLYDSWEEVDILVTTIANVFSSKKKRYTISGVTYDTSYVKGILEQVTNKAAVNVLNRYLAREEHPENPEAYLLTAIFNEILNPTKEYDEE